MPFACISDSFTFHSKLFTTSAVGLLLQVFVVVFYGISTLSDEPPKQTKRALRWAMFLLYVVYPSTTSVAFETFNCNNLGDIGEYLKVDYRIDCSSPEHASAKRVAWGMIVVFAIGVPVMFLVLMFRDRSASFLNFFCKGYHKEYYFWEFVDIVKKLLLVGFAVMFKQGSIVQVVCGMLVALFYWGLLLRCAPYKQGTALANTSSLMLVLSFLGALLIKFSNGTAEGIYEEGYTTDFVSGLLLCFDATIILQVAIEIVLSAYQALKFNADCDISKTSEPDISSSSDISSTKIKKIVL